VKSPLKLSTFASLFYPRSILAFDWSSDVYLICLVGAPQK
jgi:hypothetical protein